MGSIHFLYPIVVEKFSTFIISMVYNKLWGNFMIMIYLILVNNQTMLKLYIVYNPFTQQQTEIQIRVKLQHYSALEKVLNLWLSIIRVVHMCFIYVHLEPNNPWWFLPHYSPCMMNESIFCHISIFRKIRRV